MQVAKSEIKTTHDKNLFGVLNSGKVTTRTLQSVKERSPVEPDNYAQFFQCLRMGMSIETACDYSMIPIDYIRNLMSAATANPRLEPHATILRRIKYEMANFEFMQVKKITDSSEPGVALKLLERRRSEDYSPVTKVDVKAQLIQELTAAITVGAIDYEFIKVNYPELVSQIPVAAISTALPIYSDEDSLVIR